MKHPKSTLLLSSVAALESFSFYIFAGLLVLFMVDVLHFSQAFAASLFGILLGSTYLFQIFGGYLCDKYLGNRKATLIGVTCILIAQLITYDASLYYQTANVAAHSSLLFTFPEIVFLIGSGIMAIGVSFFKVSVASFISLFYKDDEKLLNSAFSIFYMFINIGGFFAPLTINFIVGVHHPELYQYGFLVGFIVILITIIIFLALKNRVLVLENGEVIGVLPISKTQIIDKNNNISEKLSELEINHLKVIFLVLISVLIYLVGNQQIFSSIVLFAESNVNNIIPFINYEIVPQLYISLNPLFIIILSPFYIKLNEISDKKGISSLTKIGVSLLVLALTYLVLVIGTCTFDGNMKINMIWMILFSLILVNSELLIMPVTLSLVSKLAPEKYTTSMIGLYYVTFSIGEVITGLFAAAIPLKGSTMLLGIIPIANLTSYFMVFVIIGIVCGTIWLLVKNRISKLITI